MVLLEVVWHHYIIVILSNWNQLIEDPVNKSNRNILKLCFCFQSYFLTFKMVHILYIYNMLNESYSKNVLKLLTNRMPSTIKLNGSSTIVFNCLSFSYSEKINCDFGRKSIIWVIQLFCGIIPQKILLYWLLICWPTDLNQCFLFLRE